MPAVIDVRGLGQSGWCSRRRAPLRTNSRAMLPPASGLVFDHEGMTQHRLQAFRQEAREVVRTTRPEAGAPRT